MSFTCERVPTTAQSERMRMCGHLYNLDLFHDVEKKCLKYQRNGHKEYPSVRHQ